MIGLFCLRAAILSAKAFPLIKCRFLFDCHDVRCYLRNDQKVFVMVIMSQSVFGLVLIKKNMFDSECGKEQDHDGG